MRCTVSGTVTHLCPHVDEVDNGTFRIDFDGPAPELHALRRRIARFHGQRITHEELTQTLADELGVTVSTSWVTAGLDLHIEATPATRAVPGDGVH